MRAALVVLMLALLPWRLWAADAMAVRMAQADVAATVAAVPAASAEQPSSLAGMPADCPMLAALADDAQPGDGQAGVHCPSCHLCAASAFMPLPVAVQQPAPAGPPRQSAGRYTSTAPAPDLRPPIS